MKTKLEKGRYYNRRRQELKNDVAKQNAIKEGFEIDESCFPNKSGSPLGHSGYITVINHKITGFFRHYEPCLKASKGGIVMAYRDRHLQGIK